MLFFIASMQKYLQSEWSRGVQDISHCILNNALYKLPIIVEANQVENKRTKRYFKNKKGIQYLVTKCSWQKELISYFSYKAILALK